MFSKEILDTYTRASIELNIFLLTITESPRRYISDKIVGGFIYILSISYLYPIYVLGDIVKQIRGKGFY